MNPIINFRKLNPDAQLPTYGSAGAAGADVRSTREFLILPGDRALVPTGLGCEIAEGYELQVRPRSGLAFKNGVTVLNAPGTIDEDYKGELGILLLNTGGEPFRVAVGDRIAQIVVAPVVRGVFGWTDDVSESARGQGGFGSTGVA